MTPPAAISLYLQAIYAEATARGYRFDSSKIQIPGQPLKLVVTSGQLDYGWRHLMNKLAARNFVFFQRWQETITPTPHPIFEVRAGKVELWKRP